MHPRTELVLGRLRRIAWFANVGKVGLPHAIILNSWEAAIESSNSALWRRIRLEAANWYSAEIARRVHGPSPRWSEVTAALRPHCEAVVPEKLGTLSSLGSAVSALTDILEWDVLHICLESEFADIIGFGF